MKRAERNEFNYIRRSLKQFTLGYGTTVTIRTDASSEYKHALDSLYTSLNFHPAGITTNPHYYDDKERIVYIFGQTWLDDQEREHSWKELYTQQERESYSSALD